MSLTKIDNIKENRRKPMKTMSLSTACRTLCLGVLLTMVIAANFIHGETVKIDVPKAMVIAAFNTGLSGMGVKIDNYGPKHGTSWLKQESFVRMPDGSKKAFSIPEHTTNLTSIRKWRHYVDDFNSNQLSAAAGDGVNLIFTINFESQGEEVKGKCLRKKINGSWTECSLDMERDFHINNASVEVQVTLTPLSGAISYKNPQATFKADVSIPNKLCQLFGQLCKKIENLIYQGIQKAVQDALEAALNNNTIKNAVANAVKSKIQGVIDPAWQITNIESNGSNYRITVQRPDTIDQGSVSIQSFSVVQKNATINCPGKVEFKATISTTTKVSGTVYLEHENGQKSGVHPWNMPKKGSATSSLSRTWTANDFKAHSGWSRMVVKWKGTDGKTYSKTSGKASFTRTCSKGASDKLKFK